MTTVRDENLHVVLEKDRGRVVLGVPGDVPFTAASIQATLDVLRQRTHDPVELRWSRMFGMRFILPVDDDEVSEFDFESLANLDLPLRVEQPPSDEGELDVLFIDTDQFNDSVAVLRPERVLTSNQLKQLVDHWVEQQPHLAGDWRLYIESNCLGLSSSEASRPMFHSVLQPKYQATGSATVRIHYDERGRTRHATVSVWYSNKQKVAFEPDIESVSKIPSFSDVQKVRSRGITAHYEDVTLKLEDPIALMECLEPEITSFMYALGIHPRLGGELKVVLDQSYRAPNGSHDCDVTICRAFPIRLSRP